MAWRLPLGPLTHTGSGHFFLLLLMCVLAVPPETSQQEPPQSHKASVLIHPACSTTSV